MLQSNTVDWAEVVKLSTAHYVFPALYCNLKRASFLSYLPEDLVEYMKYITDLNRKRNEEILAQAEELNTLLLEHNITPIFIKGTGNLLEGLYEDIAERMVGDIDFIFSKEEFPRAVKILTSNGYPSNFKIENVSSAAKHYPRLINNDKICAIEIHKEFLIEKYNTEFNYNFAKSSFQTINKFLILSFENQLILSIAAHQINDQGYLKKNIALRNAYDVFLLSKKTNAKDVFQQFNALQHPLHCFLASCYEAFNKPQSLTHINSTKIKKYLIQFNKLINDKKLAEQEFKKSIRKRMISRRIEIIFKSFFYKKYRVWLFKRITDKKWRKEKLIQLGIKKP
jgi:hypothetical protein